MRKVYKNITHNERREFVKGARVFINTFYGSDHTYITCFHNDNSNTFILEGVEVKIDDSYQYEKMFDIEIIK